MKCLNECLNKGGDISNRAGYEQSHTATAAAQVMRNMRVAVLALLLLATCAGRVACQDSIDEGPTAVTIVKALATGPDSAASVIGKAAARGNTTAIAEAIAEATQEGKAEAIAEAIITSAQSGNQEAVAEALAQVTGSSVGDARQKLETGNSENLALALATSTGGVTRAVAKATSEAVAESRNSIVSAVTRAVSNVRDGANATAAAQVAAEAVGEAIAAAYARAEVSLEVQGTGEAFGTAGADVRAVAEASAKALAEAFAEATNNVGVARAQILGEAVTTVVAEAAASAFAEADLVGPGKVQTIQETLANAVAIPIARVIGDALAVTFQGKSESSTYVVAETSVEEDVAVESTGDVNTQGEAAGTATGDADAVTDQTQDEAVAQSSSTVNDAALPPPRCTTRALSCCLGTGRKRTLCGCFGRGENRRCRFSREAERDGITSIWKDTSNGSLCSC